MFFNELTNEARQRLIDVQQRGDALRAVRDELRQRFAGTMAWKTSRERDYLYRRTGHVEKSLGPLSPETETAYAAFTSGKRAAEAREAGLRLALEGMAAVNRAMGLGRIPTANARILRRLDAAGVLGKQVCVVGTNALFAYEAHAGVRFGSDLLATNDIDIALDARRSLALAAATMPNGLIGLLRLIDRSFEPITSNGFRAVNAAGLMVDLITAEPKNRMAASPGRRRRLGGGAEDMEAVEVPRLELIVDAPRFATTAIAADGLPVWIAAADPRWWAAHKLWLAAEPTRDPAKRQRDRDQGLAVATMLARNWTTPDLSDNALSTIPVAVRRVLRDAIGAAGDAEPPIW